MSSAAIAAQLIGLAITVFPSVVKWIDLSAAKSDLTDEQVAELRAKAESAIKKIEDKASA